MNLNWHSLYGITYFNGKSGLCLIAKLFEIQLRLTMSCLSHSDTWKFPLISTTTIDSTVSWSSLNWKLIFKFCTFYFQEIDYVNMNIFTLTISGHLMLEKRKTKCNLKQNSKTDWYPTHSAAQAKKA